MERSILDNVENHIAVCKLTGEIVYTNKPWNNFGIQNKITPGTNWVDYNYIDVCKKSALKDADARRVLHGLTDIANGMIDEFWYDYPCHSPTEDRWFRLYACILDDKKHMMVSHILVTEFVNVEKELEKIKRETQDIDEIRRVAYIDPLSNVLNRRGFRDTLDHMIAQSIRYEHSLTVVLMDIDYFKQINDTHGHAAGDEAIQIFAERIKQRVRQSDVVGRLGGDEFAIIFPETSGDVAMQLCELIRVYIESDPLYGDINNTISYGLCELYEHHTPSSILNNADKALYKAKHKGRNCGVLFDPDIDGD